MHDLQRVDAVGRVRAVAAFAGDANGFRHVALVHHYRYQTGGFADHRIVGLDGHGAGNGAGTGHGGFFVGGGQNTNRFGELAQIQVFQRFHDKGKEAFHVDGAQAVKPVAFFGQLERVLGPAARVEGHCVGMTGQQQAAVTFAFGGQQVELAGQVGQLGDLDRKAELTEPVCQQANHLLVTLIPAAFGAADRGEGDDVAVHVQQVERCHRISV